MERCFFRSPCFQNFLFFNTILILWNPTWTIAKCPLPCCIHSVLRRGFQSKLASNNKYPSIWFSQGLKYIPKTLSNQLVNWLYKRSQSSIPFYIFQFSFQKTPRSLNQTMCWMLKSCPSSILLLLLDYWLLWTHPQTGLVVYKDSFWVSTGPHSTPQHDSPSTRCFKLRWKSNLTSKYRQKENVTQEILTLQLGNSSENGAQIS
jgi:hypothetical protein